MSYRILLLGFKDPPSYIDPDLTFEGLDPEFFDSDRFKRGEREDITSEEEASDAEELTFYDYNIIIIKSDTFESSELLHGKKEEFKTFFSVPAVLVVFPEMNLPKWLLPAELPAVIRKGGEATFPNYNHPFSSIFKKMEFEWMWNLRDKYPDAQTIAWNTPHLAVSYEHKFESGARVFFLPALVGNEGDLMRFLRTILNIVESTYLPSGGEYVEEPAWAKKYELNNEFSLRRNHEETGRELAELTLLKQVLYSYDKQLSDSVCRLFGKLGFGAKSLEREGKQDIELNLGDLLGIVEVKGLKTYAGKKHVMQLLERCVDRGSKKKKVKGIFVVNHYREKEPKDRKSPYTEEAIKIAERNELCLLTTWQLFQMLNRLMKEEIGTDSIKQSILETMGELKLDANSSEG